MKRLVTVLGVAALLMSFGLALAMDHGPVEHGHLLVLGLQVDSGGNYSIHKCVELANGRALKNNAHHDNLHTGRAGQAMARAGHAVIPTAPLPSVPWSNCAELKAAFGID
jgi:hypothetical protein